MSWLPRDLTLLCQNQQRIIPPHVSFTVLLSPKATGRRLQYTAYCGGVVGLIWGLEKCLLPPSVGSILVCIHCQSGKLSFPLCIVVARLLCMLCCRSSGVDLRLSCCHSILIWGETSVSLQCPCCSTIKPYLSPPPSPLPLSLIVSSSPSPVSACLCLFSLVLPGSWWSDFEGACRWGSRQLGTVLIEPSLCLVTVVCRSEQAREWIQAALKSPAGSITGKINKTETCRVPRSGSLLSLVSRTSTRDWSMWEYGLR